MTAATTVLFSPINTQNQMSKRKGPLKMESNSPTCMTVETEAREGKTLQSRSEGWQSWDWFPGRLCQV